MIGFGQLEDEGPGMVWRRHQGCGFAFVGFFLGFPVRGELYKIPPGDAGPLRLDAILAP